MAMTNVTRATSDREARLLHWRPDRWDWREKHRIVWVSVAKVRLLQGLLLQGAGGHLRLMGGLAGRIL
jgi:hypothetical protein